MLLTVKSKYKIYCFLYAFTQEKNNRKPDFVLVFFYSLTKIQKKIKLKN